MVMLEGGGGDCCWQSTGSGCCWWETESGRVVGGVKDGGYGG